MSIPNSNQLPKTPLDVNLDFVAIALAQAPKENLPLEPVKYYCKKCEKIVEVITKERPLQFICSICKKSGVVVGTESSLSKFYHLNK